MTQEAAKEAPRKLVFPQKREFEAVDFSKWYDNYDYLINGLDLTQPGAEKGLAALLYGVEKSNMLDGATHQEVTQDYGEVVAFTQQGLADYIGYKGNVGVIAGLSEIADKTWEGLIFNLDAVGNTGTQWHDNAVKGVKKIKKVETALREGDQEVVSKYVMDWLEDVDKIYRGILARHSSDTIFRNGMANDRKAVLDNFRTNDKPELDRTKVGKFFDKNMSSYRGRAIAANHEMRSYTTPESKKTQAYKELSTKAQEAGKSYLNIGLNLAKTAYNSLEAAKAAEKAEQDAKKAPKK